MMHHASAAPCPQCATLTDWRQPEPIIGGGEPYPSGCGMERQPHEVTGWRLCCGCELDGWSYVVDTVGMTLSWTSPTGDVHTSGLLCGDE